MWHTAHSFSSEPASIVPRSLPRSGDETVHHPLGVSVTYWNEFKNTILPWVLAAGVVTFLITEHRRTTDALLGANSRLAEAVEEQGKALEGVRQLLASQGYTLPLSTLSSSPRTA